jgi:predicted GIY-YIG superfamily endonuclease
MPIIYNKIEINFIIKIVNTITMVYIYTLQLEQGKYYIGKTSNPDFRIEQHFQSGGAIWTKKYKPVSIVEIVRGDTFVEKAKTLEYMKLEGFKNVRGSHWCKIDYPSIPQAVQDYISGSTKGTCIINE